MYSKISEYSAYVLTHKCALRKKVGPLTVIFQIKVTPLVQLLILHQTIRMLCNGVRSLLSILSNDSCLILVVEFVREVKTTNLSVSVVYNARK